MWLWPWLWPAAVAPVLSLAWESLYASGVVLKKKKEKGKKKKTESERMEEDIPCKWKSKDSWSSNTHIRQKTLKSRMLQETKKDIT